MDWPGIIVGAGVPLIVGAIYFVARRLTSSLDHDSRIRTLETLLGSKADGEHVTAMLGEQSARVAALESQMTDMARSVGRIEGRAGLNGAEP